VIDAEGELVGDRRHHGGIDRRSQARETVVAEAIAGICFAARQLLAELENTVAVGVEPVPVLTAATVDVGVAGKAHAEGLGVA